MRHVIVLTVVAAVTMAAAPGAVGATPEQRIAKLERQVKALTKQVKTLQRDDRAIIGSLNANWAGDTCLASQTADLVQSTWTVIDQIAQSLQTPRTYFGPQTQVTDNEQCGSLINPEVPRMGIRTPPVITFLVTLIDWMS